MNWYKTTDVTGVPDLSFFVPDLPSGTFKREEVKSIKEGYKTSVFARKRDVEGGSRLCFSVVGPRTLDLEVSMRELRSNDLLA